jgi:hypothetical protein
LSSAVSSFRKPRSAACMIQDLFPSFETIQCATAYCSVLDLPGFQTRATLFSSPR